MLWKAITFGTSKPCANPISFGYNPNCCKYFGSHVVQHCVLNQSWGYWLLSNALLRQCHLYVKCRWIVWHLILVRFKTLMMNFMSYNINACKKGGSSSKTLPCIYVFFSNSKTHNMLGIMLDPWYKGLGLVIWYVGKEKALQIASAYDRHVMFLLFICAFTF